MYLLCYTGNREQAQSLTGFRGRKHPYHPGSGLRIPASGDAVFDRQRFVGDGPPCTEGIFPGSDPLPAAARGYHVQV